MFRVTFICNGSRKWVVGSFNRQQEAVNAIKQHVETSSAINRPNYKMSIGKEIVRIDYGARDCYYVIEREENKND